MIEELLTSEIQEFIIKNERTDPSTLMLRSPTFSGISMKAIVEQIISRKKAKTKVSEWYQTDGIIYPPVLSLEQCSSSDTGLYKQSLVSGNTMADLTGGMGVDSYFLSKSFKEVTYCERQSDLVKIANHNFKRLGVENIQTLNVLAEVFLQSGERGLDLVFLDPARRDQEKNRVFRLSDCEPNVIELLPLLLKNSERILIKAAPLLDIKSAITEMGGLTEVHVVGVKGEVKELLLLIEKGQQSADPLIRCVDLDTKDKVSFDFHFSEEMEMEADLGQIGAFIYEPNSSIMKGGAFKAVSKRYNLVKLHPSTHLYTSHKLISGFPGRTFQVKRPISMNKKFLKKAFPEMKANITIRNFPMSVKQIRQKTGIKEGGEDFIIGLRDANGPALVLCNRV